MQSEPEPNNEVEMVKNQGKHSESVCEEFRSETIKTDEETELISSSGIEDDDETNTDKSEMKPRQKKQAEPKFGKVAVGEITWHPSLVVQPLTERWLKSHVCIFYLLSLGFEFPVFFFEKVEQ